MTRQIAAGLMMATLVSLTVPVSVLAEDPIPSQSQTTQYNSTTTTTKTDTSTESAPVTTTTDASATSSSTVPIQPGISSLVLNNQFGYAQNEVIVGTNDGSSPMVLPKIHIGSANTSIRVLNPTSKPVTFTVPQLNLTAEVPPNGARVVQIDRVMTANLTPGQEVAYYINDTNGNQIASSNFVNNQEIASLIDINTQVASTQTTTTTSTSTASQATPTPTERKSTVRGYW